MKVNQLDIKVEELSLNLERKKVLNSITERFIEGKVTTIIGPNGAGKSTLLKCLAGIYPFSQGDIHINGHSLSCYTLKERAKLIGYVPQSSESIFPLTVMETVLLGRKPYIKWGVKENDLQKVREVLDELELNNLAQSYLDEISGGQRQKAGIARVLAQEAPILLLDEPISALDIRYQFEVLQITRELAMKKNHLIVLVLHDLELAARFSDYIILLHNGKVWDAGTPKKVLTAENLRKVYKVEATIEQSKQGIQIIVDQPIKEGDEKDDD